MCTSSALCVTLSSVSTVAPEYINEHFIKTSYVHTRNLRSVDDEQLSVPKTKSRLYENSFAVSAAKHWNNLPTQIRKS